LPILVDTVRIAGFRGAKNFEIKLPRVAVLIGPNNCGKTSILKAIQLALGDYSRQLSDEDFHINLEDARVEEIIIDARIVSASNEGKRVQTFEDEWVIEFGDKIRQDIEGFQFHAFRTVAKPPPARTGYLIERFTLQDWPNFENWLSVKPSLSHKLTSRSEFIPFVSIDAQRDIHHELNDKSSFVGRVLSQVKYESEDIKGLEKMVSEINEAAVAKSEHLAGLRTTLDSLNESFGGSGTAEVTPFPKKIRDLSKNYRVHFGQSAARTFSMEYHGMGTRSWASMLAVKAFTNMMGKMHELEKEPYHPIIAAEEPEAHLHPNAQRALFAQLVKSQGQSIISTHSPYLAAMSDLNDLRSLSARSGETVCRSFESSLDPEEQKILQRTILRNKGELLFANAILLFEGQTEDQVVPAFFEKWFGATAFSKGVSLAAVEGRNYPPYVKLAITLGIPVAIVSDNDTANGNSSKTIVENSLEKLEKEPNVSLKNVSFHISYLTDPNDFEAELITTCGLTDYVKRAFVKCAASSDPNPHSVAAQETSIGALTDNALLEKMRAGKTSYSAFLADVIGENPGNKTREELVPLAFQDAFSKIEGWLI
jgi:putative ATP-dependent endonuclease of OLD family